MRLRRRDCHLTMPWRWTHLRWLNTVLRGNAENLAETDARYSSRNALLIVGFASSYTYTVGLPCCQSPTCCISICFLGGRRATWPSARGILVKRDSFPTSVDKVSNEVNGSHFLRSDLSEYFRYRPSRTSTSSLIVVRHSWSPSSCLVWKFKYRHSFWQCFRPSQIVLVDCWPFLKTKLGTLLSTLRFTSGMPLRLWLLLQRERSGST